jgi:phosphoribosyl-ATP pyrophosphohydrolase
MILDDVYKIIQDRKRNRPQGSYVASLLSKGKDEILKKIGEEAMEVIIASKAGQRQQIVNELSDLWFHCLVLMAEEGITHEDIFTELQNRFGRRQSG